MYSLHGLKIAASRYYESKLFARAIKQSTSRLEKEVRAYEEASKNRGSFLQQLLNDFLGNDVDASNRYEINQRILAKRRSH